MPNRSSSDAFLDGSGEAPVLALLPQGSFWMGFSENEQSVIRACGYQIAKDAAPPHHVAFEKPLMMGCHPVAVGEYRAFVSTSGYRSSRDWEAPGFPQTEAHPVVAVGWHDARSYCDWLTVMTGNTYRLPTEAEWEYGARGGTNSLFSTGWTITPDQANFDGTFTFNGSSEGAYRKGTSPVDAFSPNPFGLYDMHGNVWEWTADCYDEQAYETHDQYPQMMGDWDSTCPRVIRGGCWNASPRFLFSAVRIRYVPAGRSNYQGFRVVREV